MIILRKYTGSILAELNKFKLFRSEYFTSPENATKIPTARLGSAKVKRLKILLSDDGKKKSVSVMNIMGKVKEFSLVMNARKVKSVELMKKIINL